MAKKEAEKAKSKPIDKKTEGQAPQQSELHLKKTESDLTVASE